MSVTTRKSEVTRWRVLQAERLLQSYPKASVGAQPKERRAVVNLIDKFKFLRPEIVPEVQ